MQCKNRRKHKTNTPMTRSFRIAFGIFILSLLVSPSMLGQSAKKAHELAHKAQLANAKSAIDKSVIMDFIKSDIEKRENIEPIASLISHEMDIMLDDLLAEAKSHIGKRYRSGGKGPSAFDCSGFSSYVYRQFGYSLGASSRDQYLQGEEVKEKDLRKGDLVFFTGRNRKRGVGHVGIVVKADNEKGTFTFIHASTSQGIRIDTNTGYYEGRYLGAKRIINDVD